jgi:hypothetical protein
MVKHAFVKTMEAFIAIILAYLFLLIIVPRDLDRNIQGNAAILSSFEQDSEFRACALSDDEACVRAFVDGQIPEYFTFEVLLTEDPNEIPTLPRKQVLRESLYLSGNLTLYSPVIVKLFYWIPEETE